MSEKDIDFVMKEWGFVSVQCRAAQIWAKMYHEPFPEVETEAELRQILRISRVFRLALSDLW